MNKDKLRKVFKTTSIVTGGILTAAAVVVPLTILPPAPYGYDSSKNDEEPCTDVRDAFTEIVGRDLTLVRQFVTEKYQFQQDEPGSMCYDAQSERSYIRANHRKFVTKQFTWGVHAG